MPGGGVALERLHDQGEAEPRARATCFARAVGDEARHPDPVIGQDLLAHRLVAGDQQGQRRRAGIAVALRPRACRGSCTRARRCRGTPRPPLKTRSGRISSRALHQVLQVVAHPDQGHLMAPDSGGRRRSGTPSPAHRASTPRPRSPSGARGPGGPTRRRGCRRSPQSRMAGVLAEATRIVAASGSGREGRGGAAPTPGGSRGAGCIIMALVGPRHGRDPLSTRRR